MKILETKALEIPDVKVISFARFTDQRGYFTEQFRASDFQKIDFMKNVNFVQCNESYSKKGVIRGLHFQWNPYMGKLVRCLSGRLIDFALDIRKGSETFGKIVGYELSASPEKDFNEWIWVPPGFAHGVVFPEDSLIEYFCSGEYSPDCEAGISPLASDIDWSLCDPELSKIYREIAATTELITDKDREAFTLGDWSNDQRSENFTI